MPKTMPLVSIVTPSFNSGDFLEQAILSVTNQDYNHIEHIVMDGGSTDQTLEILRRYGAPVVWTSEADEGQADAINKGFRQAQGEIIGWLNADDMYQPAAIGSAVAYLQAHPDVDLVYGGYHFIDARNQIIDTHIAPEFALERLLYGDAIIPQTSMFFRRHILEETGGVDAGLHYVMDWEFTFRIARVYNVARVAEAWGNFRIVEGTKSVQQPEKFWPEIIAVLQKVIQEEPDRFKPWTTDALFKTHLLAALEFARAGQVAAMQSYAERAFGLNAQPCNHPAVLASGLYQAAVYPWHSAFRTHPQAQQALDNLSTALTGSPAQRRVLGYLYLYRALRGLRQGNLGQVQQHLSGAKTFLARRDLFDWRSARMSLGAILKK